jgi:hypothetical protein
MFPDMGNVYTDAGRRLGGDVRQAVKELLVHEGGLFAVDEQVVGTDVGEEMHQAGDDPRQPV